MAAPSRLVQRANVLFFGVLVAILLIIGGMTWDRFNAAYTARGWSDQSYQILRALKDLRVAIVEAESGQRGFVLTGNETYLNPYRQALGDVGFLQGELQRLTADNPLQQARLKNLSPVLQHKMEELAQTIELRRTLGQEAATRVVSSDAGRDYMAEATAIFSAMLDDERRLLNERLALSDRRNQWLGWLILGGTLLTMFILLLATRMLNEAWNRAHDVETEQRGLAGQLRTALNSLSQGVAVFDAEHNLKHWNRTFQGLLDLPHAVLRGGGSYEGVVSRTRVAGEPMLESSEEIRDGAQLPGEAAVYERTRADGHLLEFRRTPTPENGFVLTVTDMTKRAEAESVLREAQKMQAIGQLTGGIAHDFNNLLQVILGNLEFAKSKIAGDERLTQRLERATWAAQRGANLTAQLLAFARRQPVDPVPIDLKQSLPQLVPLLQRTIGAQIEVRYNQAEDLWPAMADAAQTESAVLNLALNARDAMPNGGRLTIEAGNAVITAADAARHADVEAGEYVMVAVADTGHGMTPDILARVFEPFFTTKPEGKGTGLGLAMVFGFIRQCRGHVEIDSEPGRGTSVRLYLPRAQTASQEDANGAATSALPRGSATVLIVEDEPHVREIAVAILGDLGYQVLEATDGEEALDVFTRHAAAVDLLLTDLVLPGKITGRELADRLTGLRPEMPVIFMSGYTEQPAQGGRGDEGTHRLAKPFKREQLARKVAEVLGTRAAKAGGSDNVVSLSGRR